MSARAYIEHAFLDYLKGHRFDSMAARKWIPAEEFDQVMNEALSEALEEYGLTIGDRYRELVGFHINALSANGALLSEGDSYTGLYRRIQIGPKDEYVDRVMLESEISTRLKTLGAPAIERALKTISRQEGWDASPDGVVTSDQAQLGASRTIPASDRVVALSHNQQVDLENATTALIDVVERENSIEGDAGLRQQILGQLKAGRELIRAQFIRVFLLEETLLVVLGTLIDRYKGAAIAEVAKKLLDLLIEHVFGK